MSILLDAYAVIAALRGEAAALDVRRIMRKGPVWTTAVNAAEIVDRMVRLEGADADDITLEIEMLGIEVSPITVELGIDAGHCRADHYHREHCSVSLADCIAAVAARQAESALATSDRHLANLAQKLGIDIFPLPDTTGRRPAELEGG